MNNISLQNSNTLKLQQQKALEKQANQPEFSAIDKDKIKQDTVELAQQGHEAVKENWIFSTLRNVFHIKDPKKFLTSLGLTLATVVGLAYIGNKSVNKMTDLGQKVDDFLVDNKFYKGISSFFENAKNKTVETLRKSKTIDDIFDTMQNRKATPKADYARGYGRGFISIFSLTPIDIINTFINHKQSEVTKEFTDLFGKKGAQSIISSLRDEAKKGDTIEKLKEVIKDENKVNELIDKLSKSDSEVLTSLKKLFGETKASEFFTQLTGSKIKDNRKFCSEMTEALADNFNLKDASGKINKKALKNFLVGLKKGSVNNVDLSEFTNITMDQGGLISSWWPVNIINSAGKKLFKNSHREFGKGNFGDSMMKFNVVNGSLADTKIGSLVQKSILVPTESVSNFVNDKSGLGAFLCASIMSLYNNVQDAPDDKKFATIADDYIGTIGSIAISTPMAFATTYGLASIGNLKGKTALARLAKNTIGKFFNDWHSIFHIGNQHANTS